MSTATIGTDLERLRLEERARRIERVLEQLRDRSVYRRSTMGRVPAPLREAIRGFDTELRDLNRRLQRYATA